MLLLVACINILFVLVKCACAAPKIILLLRTRVLSSFSLSRNITTANVCFHFISRRESSFIKVSSSLPDPRFGARWTLIGIDIELVRSFFLLTFLYHRFTVGILLVVIVKRGYDFRRKADTKRRVATDGHTYSLGNVTCIGTRTFSLT